MVHSREIMFNFVALYCTSCVLLCAAKGLVGSRKYCLDLEKLHIGQLGSTRLWSMMHGLENIHMGYKWEAQKVYTHGAHKGPWWACFNIPCPKHVLFSAVPLK